MDKAENKKVFVAGCGGLGCYIVENLIRMKVGSITVCDGDVFSESNLNRQLYSSPENIGKLKTLCAKKRAEELGYSGIFTAEASFLSEENIDRMLAGADLAIDALDNTKARFILEAACKRHNIPLVHGAVGEWNYQIAVAMPGSDFLRNLYQGRETKNDIPTFAFTVQSCAAAETAEALKLLRGEETELRNALLLADLKDNSYEIIKMQADE